MLDHVSSAVVLLCNQDGVIAMDRQECLVVKEADHMVVLEFEALVVVMKMMESIVTAIYQHAKIRCACAAINHAIAPGHSGLLAA